MIKDFINSCKGNKEGGILFMVHGGMYSVGYNFKD